MEQYMEDKCLYIRPNNKGLFDMNLICNIRLVENRPQVCYEITFMNKDISPSLIILSIFLSIKTLFSLSKDIGFFNFSKEYISLSSTSL